MISQTAEYALRAVVCLARTPDRALTARELAEEGELPPDYASKVLKELVRAGIAVGRRGLGGGYRLAGPAAGLTLLEVVSAVDPIRRIHTCPLGRADHVRLCPLHRRLDAVAAEAEAAFEATTVAQLLAEEGGGGLCADPGD